MKLMSKFYSHLPLGLQNLGISIYGLYWHKRRFGGIFKEKLREYKAREFFNEEEWDDYQNRALVEILTHANEKVPYYRAKFSELGISNFELLNLNISSIHRLPMLEKDTLRKIGKSDLMAENYDRKGDYYTSSGSTGTPTSIYFSWKFHQNWSASFEARIRNWAGLNLKTTRGMIGGRRVVMEGRSKGPFYRYNFAEKQTYFSAYHISLNSVSDYINGMKRHSVEYLTGYAMSNYFLAKFIEESGLKAPKLKAIITSSEKLTPEMRATFERVYGCKTYDSYSGVEACGLISECEYGKLHISPDVGILEIIKPNGEYALPGETGELICTGLLNFDQPLIRYRIGDVVRLSKNQTCNCGRNMTIIDEIIGRHEDTVVGSDGRLMVRFHGVFIDLPNIIEGQIIQEEIDVFQINIVSTSELTDDILTTIKSRMTSQLGEVQVFISRVDSIPRNNNGKFKAVISKVKLQK